MKRIMLAAAISMGAVSVQAADSIRIAHVTGFTGPLAPYAEQLDIGLNMGFEYATDGTMKIEGRQIEISRKDTQLDPARARALVEEAPLLAR